MEHLYNSLSFIFLLLLLYATIIALESFRLYLNIKLSGKSAAEFLNERTEKRIEKLQARKFEKVPADILCLLTGSVCFCGWFYLGSYCKRALEVMLSFY